MELDYINFSHKQRQIYNPEKFLPNRYLVNKIRVILSNFLEDSRIKKNKRLAEIYIQLFEFNEPYDLYTGNLKSQDDLDVILELYREVNSILDSIKNDFFG